MDTHTTKDYIKAIDGWDAEQARLMIPGSQVAIYTMAGGGMIGRMYAEQPHDAYTDSRVSQRPYGARALERARLILVALAVKAGLDPRRMPRMIDVHNMASF